MSNVPHPVLQQRVADGRTWSDIVSWITAGYWLDNQHVIHGPNVTYRPIPESTTQPKITAHSAILHTNAGGNSARSLWAYITRAQVVGEPHFQVAYNGVEQYMPTNRRADCNYSANAWSDAKGHVLGAISFETQDNGAATVETTPWSLTQVNSMTAILTVLAVVYGIQCTQPAAWDASGIGHHSLFPFQGPLRKAWTNVRGKTCPGRARIAQMDHIRSVVAHNLAVFSEETGWKCGGK